MQPQPKKQLDGYKKFLLNRVTVSPAITDYIETHLLSEDEAAKHSFHKIMVLNWMDSMEQLFDVLSEYFSSWLIPVNCITQGDITIFHTSNLNIILKIIKLDFMFPHNRNMFNVNILFNDKSSEECFGNRVTIEDIVTGIVSRRFSSKCELDLSNFCNHPEFAEKKICFYKLSLLTNFKILMIRMGRDTRALNLSKNNLTCAPLELFNFFIKGDLISVNLSYNNIPSILELFRVSSRIEKLWLEGNPLCEDVNPVTYVKSVVMKFPRLSELDGIKLNQHGLIFPFFKNYLLNTDKKTRMIVEKFLTLYIAHYDSLSRKTIDMFYHENAMLSITTDLGAQEADTIQYKHSRNMKCPIRRKLYERGAKIYNSRIAIASVFVNFPPTVHDPSTFTIDVLMHDSRGLILIVDGVYKEPSTATTPERIYQFRRTFIFDVYIINSTTLYHITNEMFHITFATPEQIENSFKQPIRNMNALSLMNAEPEEIECIIKAFSHLTQLRKSEAECRLKLHDWDFRLALKDFIAQMKNGTITNDKFIEDDDFSDSSSILDEID